MSSGTSQTALDANHSTTEGGHDDSHSRANPAKIPDILPRERVFPIQVGGEVFKLSGASLSSDGTWTTVSETDTLF